MAKVAQEPQEDRKDQTQDQSPWALPGFGRLDDDGPSFFDRAHYREQEAIPIEEVAGEPDEKQEEPETQAEPEDQGTEDKQQPPIKGSKADDELVDIVVNGQVHRVPKSRLQDLAARGLRYEQEVKPLEPALQVIRSDPGAQQALEAYLRQRVTGGAQPTQPQPEPEEFKPEPITEFSSEEEWLAANIRKYDQYLRSRLQAQQPQAPQVDPNLVAQQARVEALRSALMARDPEHFQTVVAKLPEYARKLPVEVYEKVNSDPAALVKFYGWVRKQVLGDQRQAAKPTAQAQQSQPAQPTTPKPSFRARSGGGIPPRPTTDEAWEMSREEFERRLAEAKGFI